MGVRDEDVARLRHDMMRCTVENRPKDLAAWATPLAVADSHEFIAAGGSAEGWGRDASANARDDQGIRTRDGVRDC